ncbi:hypothetical protein DBT_2303 [Dissulfuribacter thermophilus]|uniref:Uncharacterized protein n=1 Tax=Dissulfuribacter thermophilus TaxID=1156395 RepID=A0A1B9F3A0_9BACT|nr:hypothetical protein DBT_2303 [Dissulfuribacter thermophilus]
MWEKPFKVKGVKINEERNYCKPKDFVWKTPQFIFAEFGPDQAESIPCQGLESPDNGQDFRG